MKKLLVVRDDKTNSKVATGEAQFGMIAGAYLQGAERWLTGAAKLRLMNSRYAAL